MADRNYAVIMPAALKICWNTEMISHILVKQHFARVCESFQRV